MQATSTNYLVLNITLKYESLYNSLRNLMCITIFTHNLAMIFRGDRMLNPGEVAEAVVAGIRYGKRYVYIPRINIISDTIFG